MFPKHLVIEPPLLVFSQGTVWYLTLENKYWGISEVMVAVEIFNAVLQKGHGSRVSEQWAVDSFFLQDGSKFIPKRV